MPHFKKIEKNRNVRDICVAGGIFSATSCVQMNHKDVVKDWRFGVLSCVFIQSINIGSGMSWSCSKTRSNKIIDKIFNCLNKCIRI